MIAKTLAGVLCLSLLTFGSPASSDAPLRRQGVPQDRVATTAEPSTAIPDSPGGLGEDLGGPRFGSSAACSDATGDCGDPVKFLGKQNGCACFACRYATANQKTVCTTDPNAQQDLMKRAK